MNEGQLIPTAWYGSKIPGHDETNNSNGEDSDLVEKTDDGIYFYCDVNSKNNFVLNKLIRSSDKESQVKGFCFGVPPLPVQLRISSFGGSIFAAMGSVDHILSCRAPVHTYIEGCAASAGTIMSVVGKERYIGEHGYMLIHQLRASSWGKYNELKDGMKNVETFMKHIKNIYEQYTNVPNKEMDKILSHDLWWDAKTCLKYGLVDEITTCEDRKPVKRKAS